MGRSNQPFRFKQFEVCHSRSSMKVGVDAVVLGAWADIASANNILDVGCGCGVITLMCAQRNPSVIITAIDIDYSSVAEASYNFEMSPWSERLCAKAENFMELSCCGSKNDFYGYDYIISNPPYFDSGIDNPDSVRLKARHQYELSPASLIRHGATMLNKGGKIGLVAPFEQYDKLTTEGKVSGLNVVRSLVMTGREGRTPKRIFMEFSHELSDEVKEILTIESSDGSFTEQYRTLCKEFYLKF